MMLKTKPIIYFSVVFFAIYGLLLAPWPGWKDFYGQYYRATGNLFFSSKSGKRLLYFEAHQETQGLASVDSRIVLGNHDQANADGKLPVRMLSLDSRGMGWVPTALTIALILATPIAWIRRLWALAWGMLLVNVFIVGSLSAYIWDESPNVSLFTLSPFWHQVADGLEYTLITQYGASFYVPVLIWMVVTFRPEDFKERSKYGFVSEK